jgi:hypothetical protein
MKRFWTNAAAALLFSLTGCGFGTLPGQLSLALLEHPDPETVRDGAPAYLVMADALIAADPENSERLAAGARLYAFYAVTFVEDPERRRRLAGRARDYGYRALCAQEKTACHLMAGPYDLFQAGLNEFGRAEDVPGLFAMTVGWMAWIQANSENWEAVADLPKVETLLNRIVFLDEGYQDGAAHTLLGVLLSLRPPALGGRPEAAKFHFERALELSGGRDFAVKVQFARSYARLVYDRELHDRLLREVLAADPAAPGLTLTNTLAQRQARDLLKSAESYF